MSSDVKIKISNTLKEMGIKPPTQYWVDIQHPFLGKTHTDKSKIQIAKFRQDKTYEEIFDCETSEKLKEIHKNNWRKKSKF